MAENKSFASLSSGLLARKGAAKPAMRPQGFGSFGGSLEDLGWNDMGASPAPLAEHVPSSIEALTPAPGGRTPQPVADTDESVEAETPAVVEQQRELEERLAPPVREAEVVRLPRSRVTTSRPKSAFTLRLDPDRHLKLRLACALTGRSAQLLVTEALDEFLYSHPELETLAQQVPAEAGQRKR
ncbi:MAG TPA: hypothetical protein VHM92_03710 [Allosphingosinicella sp.]|nr:hypothetical protein [Allosphingosinicella sp.]